MMLIVFLLLLAVTQAKQDGKQRELVVVDSFQADQSVKSNNGNNKLATYSYLAGNRHRTTPAPAKEDEYSAEHALYEQLLGKNYQKHVRPVKDHHKPITVKVGMCVMMIEDLIERDQVMIMASCVKMIWVDDFLAWDPEKYGNISWMAISSDKIWLPDIAIVNSPEPHSLTRKTTNVDLTSDGGVGYFPSGRLITRCSIAIAYFPFDRQNCEVRFESWIYPSQYLEIELYPGDEAVDIKEYYVNLHWTILGYRALPEKVDYDGKNFSCITFVFSLRRKSAFYFMYFIFPELMLALLQTLSHTLPVEHPGRMTMLTALFIGASVTHSGIAAHIPKSSDSMSLLQIYMAIVSINLVFALINSFVMLYTVLRYPNKEPSLMAMFASFFSIVWPDRNGKKGKSCFGAEIPRSGTGHRRTSRHHTSRPMVPRAESDSEQQTPPTVNEHISATAVSTRYPNIDLLEDHRATRTKANSVTNFKSIALKSSSPESPSIAHPDTWLLDPTHHRVGCLSEATELGHSPTSNSLHNRAMRATRSFHLGDADVMFSSADELTPQHHHLRPTVAGHHAPLCRNTSSFGGGVSTQYMSKAHCIQQRNTSRNFDPYDVDSEEDSYACALALPPSSGHLTPLGTLPRSRPSPRLSTGDDDVPRPVAYTTALLLDKHSAEHWRVLEKNCLPLPNGKTPHDEENVQHRPSYQKNPSSPAKPRRNESNNNSNNASGDAYTKRQSSFTATSDRHRKNSDLEQDSGGVDFKHRWLVYCVALDKSIMYVNGVWNFIIPVTLFVILPWVNEVFRLDNIMVT